MFYPFEKRKENKKMKTKLLAILLTLITLLTLVSCATTKEEPVNPTATLENENIPADGLWKDATYRENKTFGSGAKAFTLKVIAGDYYVTFTVNTDKENLAEALLEHKLVEGEDGAYGLYIKKVNGILADYDVDQTYWSFQIGGEAQMTGISEAKIEGGEAFELVRTK